MNAVTTDPQIVRALGDLEGTVRAQGESIKAMADQSRAQERDASTGRRAIHDKIDAFVVQIHHITGVAYDIQQDVAEIKNDLDENVMPTITAYNLDKAHKAGALSFGKVIWAAVLAACTAIGFAVHEAFLYFRGPSGH